jgi:hypothetical protein
MATAYDKHWPSIRENIIARINANGTAEVHSVIYALQNNGTIPRMEGWVINSEEIQTIIAPMIESRIYTPYYKNEAEVFMSKSITYEMEEITRATNITLQDASAATEELNLETKKYYHQLKLATWVIAAATVVNLLIAALPWIAKLYHKLFC